MTTKVDVLSALRQTGKGKLNYDFRWLEEGGIRALLEECSSPPTISRPSLSPNTSNSSRFIEQEESGRKIGQGLGGSPQTASTTNAESRRVEPTEAVVVDPVEDVVTPEEGIIVSPEASFVQQALKLFENELDVQIKNSMDDRKKLFEKHSEMLERQAETKVIELYFVKEHEANKELAHAQAQNLARSEEVKQKQQKLRENHKQHARMLDARMREAEAHRKQVEEDEKKKRHADSAQRVESMIKMQQELKATRQHVEQLIASCTAPQYLPDPARSCVELLTQMWAKVELIIKQARETEANTAHMQVVMELCSKARNAVDSVTIMVEAANKKGKEEQAKQQAEAAATAAASAAASQARQTTAPSVTATSTPSTVTSSAQKANVVTSSDEVLCIPIEAFNDYQNLQQHLTTVEKSYQKLISERSLKKYMMDLQKAVNLPVNAIAPTSGSHLRDKLQKICALLSGQQVEVSGKKVAATEHQVCINFCKELFAKKIVKQAEEQVASSHDSAFAPAAVAVGVWCEFPDVGQLLLAHFHRKCPYIVPYYIPKQQGQSSEDHYKSLGYNYIDGQIEKQDQFLKRMSGLMRLYSALMVSTPPRGAQHPHPHGIEHGWLWLTRVINMEPRPAITSQIIFDFLQVTGHAFMKSYGKQFIKLVRLLITDYMPKIKKVTPQGSEGPVVRLENFLQDCSRTGKFSPPDGLLPPNFWYT